MKKIFSIFSAIILISSSSGSIYACKKAQQNEQEIEILKEKIKWTDITIELENPNQLTAADVTTTINKIKDQILTDLKNNAKFKTVTLKDFDVKNPENTIKTGTNLASQQSISFSITMKNNFTGTLENQTIKILGTKKPTINDKKSDISQEKIEWTDITIELENPNQLTAADVTTTINKIKDQILTDLKNNAKFKTVTLKDFDVKNPENTIKAGTNLASQQSISFSITMKNNFTGTLENQTIKILGTKKPTMDDEKIDISNETIKWGDVVLNLIDPKDLSSSDVQYAIKKVTERILNDLWETDLFKEIIPKDLHIEGLENMISEGADLSSQSKIIFSITVDNKKFTGKLDNQAIKISTKKAQKVDISKEIIQWTDVILTLVNPNNLSAEDVEEGIITIKNQIWTDLQKNKKFVDIVLDDDFNIIGLSFIIKEHSNLLASQPITFAITALGDNFTGKLDNQIIKSITGVQIEEQPLVKVIKETSIKKIKYRYYDESQAIEIIKGIKKENPTLYSSKISIKKISKNIIFKSGTAIAYTNDKDIYTGEEIKVKFTFYYLFG